MPLRLDACQANRPAMDLLLRLDRRSDGYRLEHSLADLVRLRVSLLNGCPYCIDLHTTRARRAGEMDARIDLLPAWRDSALYTDRERAALAWSEAVTRLADHVPDAAWDAVRPHFSDRELVDLTLLVNAINALNRFGIAFRRAPAWR
ncbi:carboxymuconolactone decarboxylase family protein [Cupriavidus pauculus]|uniref:Carboxymuconolactone decarboxylase family protein n=1 Tax=Cupriavidus pauculus TaxID=82633 RepID=A0A5P2H151_9BURK|nr:carboxymuconolactone decarboxylase family protein [Cupriavidus pauculus]QET01586.1 carboxymuconolactone decarboxylase family protein [Cupriavidus pauculus]